MSTDMSVELHDIAFATWEGLGTAIALSCTILLRAGEFDQLATKDVDPRHYLDCVWGIEVFRRDYQAVKLLSALPELPTSWDRSSVALENFMAMERENCRTNIRLGALLHPFGDEATWRVYSIIEEIRKDLRWMFGRLPDTLEGRFGPGATFESRDFGRSTTRNLVVCDKISHPPAITAEARVYLNTFYYDRTLLGRLPNQSSSLVPGNRFTCVPKNAKTDRGICIEPGGNVFLQLAIGEFLSRRLKYRLGWDKEDAQLRHCKLARSASYTGNLATIDLSSASDRIARRLVELLIPEDWYCLLNDLRSPRTLVNGSWFLQEKFSSMGNGFTFELETLIFGAIARQACRLTGENQDDVSVFGDDIILPSKAFSTCISMLEFFGHRVNPQKTFADSGFRESCGGHFFCGLYVTPIKFKGVPKNPLEWFALHNQLAKLLWLNGYNCPGIRRALHLVRDRIPTAYRRFVGPIQLGDVVLHRDKPFWQVPVRRNCIDYYRGLRFKGKRISLHRYIGEVVLISALLGVPSTGAQPRGSGAVRRCRLAYS